MIKFPIIGQKVALDEHESINDSPRSDMKKKRQISAQYITFLAQIRERFSVLTHRPSIHTAIYMSATGLKYTGNGDTARCDDCGLEVSNWTADMTPFIIHSKRKPGCPFVCSIKAYPLSNVPSSSSVSTATVQSISISNKQQPSSERIKILIIDSDYLLNNLCEVDLLQQIRIRTFSHSPHRTIPSSSQMIEAGFFNCNVSDRVICLYCNLICQQWTPHTDDPCEVRKTLSPHCAYVKLMLMPAEASLKITGNKSTTRVMTKNHSPTPNNLDRWKYEFVRLAARSDYYEIPKRHASFATWPHENLPSVDDLVRAGFFYTGIKTIVTCFYCNGSLQNWGPNDNPMIENAR